MTDTMKTCRASLPDHTGFHFSPCGRPGKIEQDGKWYCGIHNPVKRAAKAAATQLAYDQKLAVDSERWRLADAAPEMLAALEACRLAFRSLSEDAGDVPIWNEGGEAYEASEQARAAIARAKGE